MTDGNGKSISPIRSDSIIYYGTLIIISWLIIWYIIYLLTGFHLQSITINNGISFNGLSFTNKSFNLSINSFRFRLWGNTRMIVVDNVTIDFKQKLSSTKKHKQSSQTTTTEDDITSAKNLIIYPSNKIFKFIIRHLIQHIPTIDIEVRHTTLNFPHINQIIKLDYLRYQLNSRYSQKFNNRIKFQTNLFLNSLNHTIIHDDNNNNQDQQSKPSVMANTIRLDLNFQIHLDDGLLDNIKVKLVFNEIRVSIFNLLKSYLEHHKYFENFENDLSEQFTSFDDSVNNDTLNHKPKPKDDKEQVKDRKIRRFLRIYKHLHSALTEFSIQLENLNLVEIPFATIGESKTLQQYFKSTITPTNSLDLIIKNSSFNLIKLQNHAAGFEVLFDPNDDVPTHLTASLQLLQLHYTKFVNNGNKSNTTLGDKIKISDEIMNIPIISITYKTNTFDQLKKGKGFKDCVMEFYSSTSNPILDLDTNQLSELFYNYVLIQKVKKLNDLTNIKVSQSFNTDDLMFNHRQFAYGESSEEEDEITKVDIDTNVNERSNQQPQQDQKESSQSSTLIQDKLYNLLNDYLPTLDCKLIMEQPRLVLRHHDIHSKKIQLLNFTYSLLDFHLITTSSRNYDTYCNVLHPTIVYHEKSTSSTPESPASSSHPINSSHEILKIKTIGLHLDVLKSLKVKADFQIDDLFIDLSKVDVLIGINTLLKDVTGLAENDLNIGMVNSYLNSAILKIKKQLIFYNRDINVNFNSASSSSASLESKVFKHLPKWLLEVKANVNSTQVSIGSRSVLISKQSISRIFGENYDADFDKLNYQLKSLIAKFDNLSITVVNQNVSKSEDEPLGNGLISSTSTSNNGSSNSTTVKAKPFWVVNSKITNFKVSTLSNPSSNKHDAFITIPTFTTKVSAIRGNNNSIKLELHLDEIKGAYDKYKLFILIGAIFVLREFIIEPVQLIKSKLKLKNDILRFQPKVASSRRSSKSIKDLLDVEVKLNSTDFVFQLSDEIKIKIQQSRASVQFSRGILVVNNELGRILTASSLVDNYWNRILSIDNFKFVTGDKTKDTKFEINTDAIRFIQPHKFVIYKLIDNISVSIKTARYLFKYLKDNSARKSAIIKPNESKIKLPAMSIKSKRVTFNMEDDPFEADLGMIYQLGLVEQRKRLEKYSLFDLKSSQKRLSKAELEQKLSQLQENISSSWIRKVKVYKSKLRQELVANKKFLFGNELNIERSKNNDVMPYSLHAPLLFVIMETFDISVKEAEFSANDLPKFLNEVGQGLPLDTKFSLLLPMHLKLNLAELRMHMRDYPLPLLHVPRNNDKNLPSLSLVGHLVIAEEFVTALEHIREVTVPLIVSKKRNKFESLIIERSLSTVKLYSDLECNFDSESPSRFVWGQSYQFAIQQFMLNFDQFSKPPIDPSSKLGFWDKLRLLMHGSLHIKSRKSIEVGFKSSRDPYDLIETASGFVLSFRKNVVWKVNDSGDSREFFDITSEKVSWYIPNYLGAPLVSWTRESSKAVSLADSNQFITSCYAYYLDDGSANNIKKGTTDVFEKNVVNLSGGVSFKVGFLLQRKNEDGERVDKSRPHYDVKLYNPKYTSEGHDSYAGFRSDYIHMAISLYANKDTSYNSIHLTPGVFKHFFHWWKLFASNMTLPVRRGILFGELKKSAKFSQHLFTNKFIFDLKDLFISHIYRDETIDHDEDRVECIGVRAKMDAFQVDLHQRKEPRFEVHEGLSRNKKILKMNFNVGEVSFSGIDVRVIRASFKQEIYTKKTKYNPSANIYTIFDGDKRWFDIQDFEEVTLPSLKDTERIFNVYPLLYANLFTYTRDTQLDLSKLDADIEIFGNENIHPCKLNSKNVFEPQINVLKNRILQLESHIKQNKSNDKLVNHLTKRIKFLNEEIHFKRKNLGHFKRTMSVASTTSEIKENFHNKFTFVGMLLKWNFDNRNNVLKYIHFVKLKNSLRKYLSYDSIRRLEKIIESNESRLNTDNMSFISRELTRRQSGGKDTMDDSKLPQIKSSDRMEKFDQILRRHSANESIAEDYLIEIISPQIQLQSEESPDSIVLIAAPSIDMKVISVVEKTSNQLLAKPVELEARYGVLLKDASIFVLDKSILKSDRLLLNKSTYGSKTNWPPWFGIEICKSGVWAGKDKLLIDKTSMMITYDDIQTMERNWNTNSNDDVESKMTAEEEEALAEDVSQEVEGAASRFNVDIPKVVLSSTSDQYITLYGIVLSLLFYSEPMSKRITEKLAELKFSVDFQDLRALYDRLADLHDYYSKMTYISRNYSFRQGKLSNEDLNNHLELNLEKGEMVTEIYLLLQTLLTGDISQQDSSSKPREFWFIRADEIICHFLENDRTPILDFALARGKYKRTVLANGSNINRIEIGILQGFNLIQNATYPELIEPYLPKGKEFDYDKNLIAVDWTMNRSVGGIKIVEGLEISSQPLTIKLDEITGDKLMNFMFSENEDGDKVSITNLTSKKRRDEVEVDADDDSAPFGFVEELEGVNKGVRFDESSGSGSGSFARGTSSRHMTRLSEKGSTSTTEVIEDEYQEQISDMLDRSKTYLSIISLQVHPISVMISIKLNSGYKRLLNVQGLLIDLPEFKIEQEIVSFLEITQLAQKRIIKTLFNHSGRVIRNKLSSKKKQSKQLMKQPLTPIKKYVKYTSISDLIATDKEKTE
ncbi:mitochondrial protein [Scheffersomyces coipomensis]|uniref:mitochondrial protein n=1 Tax=Scheffersomyces coipomensis TaxID=1788519 RepID=UPI00315DC4A6